MIIKALHENLLYNALQFMIVHELYLILGKSKQEVF